MAEGVEAHAAADDVPGLPLRLSLPVPVSRKTCLSLSLFSYLCILPVDLCGEDESQRSGDDEKQGVQAARQRHVQHEVLEVIL